jgi:hypothetical protein
VTESNAAKASPQTQQLLQNIAGRETFNLFTLSLAALAFSLGKLTAYLADRSEYLVYILSALALSQSLVIVLLAITGKVLFRNTRGMQRSALVVTVFLLAGILGSFLFELILRSWNIEPILLSEFQRVVSVLSSTVIFLGFGFVATILKRNLNQVNLGKELLATLSKQQVELSSTIRDARTYAIREVSLEIESTRGTLENFLVTDTSNQEVNFRVNQLQSTLNEVEIRVSNFSNQLPGAVRIAKSYTKIRYSFSELVSASTNQNMALPGLVSIFAFLGFSSWLSYFLTDAYAFLWGIILSVSSYLVFWAYEKYLVKWLVAQPVIIRVLVYEALVISYLFFWLLILGYFAGDNSEAYRAALGYAAIPFIFFNGGAVLGGVLKLSQNQLGRLTEKASVLRRDMADLEQIRSSEDIVWKSLFVGDIALSPTTASVILRDATLTKDHDRIMAAIPNVNALWKSVLAKLPAAL